MRLELIATFQLPQLGVQCGQCHVPGWEYSCSRDFTQVLLSTPLKPGCHLGDTGAYSAPIACGSPAVPEVVWMSAASAWFILRRLCSPAPEPVVLCSFRAHRPLSQGAASSLLQAMYYFMSLTTRNLSPPCFPLALMLVPGCTQTIHSKVKIAAGLLWLLFLRL